MKILIVSSYLPFPLFDGGRVRLYNLIKQISAKHKITLICEIRSYQTPEDIKEVKKYCEEVITIPRKKQWSKENVIKAGLSPYPFLLVGHMLPEMKQKIVSKLNDKSFDLIHVETFYVMQNLPKTYLPVVLVEHNIEYKVYERYAASAASYMRPLLNIDIAKIKYWEEKFWKKASRLVAVSEEERREMKKVISKVGFVPNGVDCDQFTFKVKKESNEKRILFMGDFKWIQNRQAAEWILKEIWPEIKLKIKNLPAGRQVQKLKINLWVVGRNMPQSLKNLGDESVIFGENEPDTLKVYKQSDILLAPIRVGGGSSYKIIEAMASGVPVVTTELGAKGIGAKNENELFVGETSEELATYIMKLLQNKTIYEKMRKKARSLIEEKYDWKNIAKMLENIYIELTAQN